jgi:mandelate racemase
MFHKLTIVSNAARAVVVPMPRPLRTASGDVPAAPLVLVDVHTNEGIVGCSYAFAYTRSYCARSCSSSATWRPCLSDRRFHRASACDSCDAQLKLMGIQGMAAWPWVPGLGLEWDEEAVRKYAFQ